MENQLLISQASILLKQTRMVGVYLVVPSKSNLFTSMTTLVEVKTDFINVRANLSNFFHSIGRWFRSRQWLA